MGHSSGRTIPAETARVARAANPRGTPAMWIRDRLNGLFVDEDFTDWYSADGRPGLPPAQLALVSVLQFAENLADRQAAQAVARRGGGVHPTGLISPIGTCRFSAASPVLRWYLLSPKV